MLSTAMNKARARKGEEGFTLIELLIVIVILGILAAIVVFSVKGITDRGDKSACNANLTSARVAVEAYYAQNPGNLATPIYPATLGATVPSFLATDPSAIADTKVKVTYAQTGGGASYTLTGGSAC